ncbi:MAG TPA: ATP-binding protein [Pseudonocardiaceae bacterium]|nr:ATP-binding protein [Pseudonocardiaceae bacterium]
MRRRILLATLLAVAVSVCALGIPLGYTAWQVVESLKRGDMDDRAQQIAAQVEDQLATGRPLDLSAVGLAVPSDGEVVVDTARTGRLTYGAHLDGADVLTEQVPIVDGGVVMLSIPAGPTRDRQAQVALLVALLALFSVCTGTVVAVLTARRLAEPLRFVAGRAGRLGAGDFRPDAARYQVPELDMVADALDTSASALALLVQRERDLVGDVSHQLRSRLTALQLRLEALAAIADPEAAEEAGAALEQAERLAQVLDELLAAASAARSGEAESIELAGTLAEMTTEWRELLRAKGRTLRLRVPDGLRARATPGRLREAIGVLLDNALRHGTGSVVLSARRGDTATVIEVSDGGPGVPDELVAHVFERGVSGGGSTGVGLALARALIDADGGRLELAASRPATFAIFLPQVRAEDVIATSWRAEPSPR